MGLGGISLWQLLIVLLIVVLLFGTKKLKGLGGDLGSAVKGFKNAISEDDAKTEEKAEDSVQKNEQKAEDSVKKTEDDKSKPE